MLEIPKSVSYYKRNLMVILWSLFRPWCLWSRCSPFQVSWDQESFPLWFLPAEYKDEKLYNGYTQCITRDYNFNTDNLHYLKFCFSTIWKFLSFNILNSVILLLVHVNFCIALLTRESSVNQHNIDSSLLHSSWLFIASGLAAQRQKKFVNEVLRFVFAY